MSRKVKELMVDEFAKRLCSIPEKGCIVLGFNSVAAKEATTVRNILAEKNARMMVVRNRLVSLSLEQLDVPELKQLIDGPTAFVLGEEPVETAKVAEKVTEETAGLSIRGGFLEGRLLAAEEVGNLAALPDRETLLSQTLMCIMSPAQMFVNDINQMFFQFASVLRQLKEKEKN
jgi:large subunit ribosomal protein L10